MDATTFIFIVLPLTAGFVGFMFALVFGPDVLRWYLKERAIQQRERRQSASVPTREPEETLVREGGRAQHREKELVSY